MIRRAISSVLMVCLLSAPVLAQETKAPTKKPAGKKAGKLTDDKSILGDVREAHVMIPMRDGIKLSTWVYTPPGQQRFPVIYHQRYVEIHGAGQRAECARLAASTECVVALQNFRGAHESEGIFEGYRPLGLGDHKDSFDSVEWFAAQPWCTGKIGSYGGSQGGYSQNFLAATQPPHLVAQYMTDFGVSLFHDGYRSGGAVKPVRFLERNAVHAREPEQGKAALAEQLKHPTFDDWWKVEDTAPYFVKMHYPSVMLGGWFDPVHKAVVQAWNGREKTFPGQQLLILGPWVHGGSAKLTGKVGDIEFPKNSIFDTRVDMAKWFGQWLLGQDNHVMDTPRVRYYVMGACGEAGAPGNEWRTDNQFPPAAVKPVELSFVEGGKLAASEKPTGGSSSTYTSDPARPNKVSATYPGAEDQRDYEKHGDVLTFSTAPLDAPVEWTGLVQAKLWFSSTARDTDLIVRVTDVYPDGRSILLMDNLRRARFRDGFEKEELLEQGKIYPLNFDLGYISIIFNKGHQIRVTIGSSGEAWYELNPQTGEEFGMELPREKVVAKNTLYHEAHHTSCIVAPMHQP